MKKLFLACLFCCHFSAYCQMPYFQQQVNYTIQVTLNDVENTLEGFETIHYTNNSPDTLKYIWFHLWPNAYKNDRTAFSEQLLKNGRTDFYFSDELKRGYINRLDFKVNGITANLQEHPQYIDVAKLILPIPLLPNQTIKISTPFYEKIPYNFSRGGYIDHTYQITQWYPKPAVYDRKGWHPMPYLDQGEFYSEFGNYHVQITVPQDYIIAATGELQNGEEVKWLKKIAQNNEQPQIGNNQASIIQNVKDPKENKSKKKYLPNVKSKTIANENKNPQLTAQTSKHLPVKTKSLTFIQNNVHDFAWFANKNFMIKYDSLRLSSGRIIDVYSFFTPVGFKVWKNSIQFIKDAIRTRSKWLGEYPYNVVTTVEAKIGFSGGMEYPTITSISPMPDEKSLEMTIEHEVGHNWLCGAIANNERLHPWMDEGMNTYFDNRYKKLNYPDKKQKKEKKDFFQEKIPEEADDLIYRMQIKSKKDQPIETSSQDFSETNYGVIAYYKTGLWMKKLEDFVGTDLFDSCLHVYYNQWKFKHPYPEDFENVVRTVSKKNVDTIFSLLSKKGNLEKSEKKIFKLASLFELKNTGKYKYLFLSPAAGYNYYDKIMIGGFIHNYTLPEPNFHFFVAPLYATSSQTLNGIARMGYNFLSYGTIRKAEISLSAEKFSRDEFTDSTGKKNYLGFLKIVPSVKLIFRNNDATSLVKKWVQWKTYFIQESSLLFSRDTIRHTDMINYPKTNRYLNQLTLAVENNRVLYPYSIHIIAEQAINFLRFTFEEKYFFNYQKSGGINARIFAGKFMYLGNKTIYKKFETDRYHLNLTGANGYEDYTYSNYFIGRNEFQSAPSQQIMIRDGGFKVRSDLLSDKIGKTDDWLAALNLKIDFPTALNPMQSLPFDIPLSVFFDAGTYAKAWQKNAPTGKFLYDAGLQISLFKQMVNIYFPLFYSKVYSDYFKSTIPKNKRFFQNISFSIDIQNFRLNKFLNLPDL
ncbi:MAG: M1 family metallopeptidase [Ginsengibacter sp.]